MCIYIYGAIYICIQAFHDYRGEYIVIEDLNGDGHTDLLSYSGSGGLYKKGKTKLSIGIMIMMYGNDKKWRDIMISSQLVRTSSGERNHQVRGSKNGSENESEILSISTFTFTAIATLEVGSGSLN